MTTPFGSRAEAVVVRTRSGRGVAFWYQAIRRARASASCRYRMGHLAELLQGLTTVVDAAPSARAFQRTSLLVVVRPCLDGRAKGRLRALRGRGVRAVADFDDLLFDGNAAEFPRVQNGELELAAAERLIAQYRDGLQEFDAFTVSTTTLADRLRELIPDPLVLHVPNGVSPFWVDQGRKLYRSWQPGDPKVIRYFAGSPSHDEDFKVVTGALGRFLRARPDVALEIVGPVALDGSDLPEERVGHLDAVPFWELPRFLASSWVTIAPLADTAFAACKSANKFLESAAFGAPCVATPNEDMLRHVGGGLMTAGGEAEWGQALEALCDDARRMELSTRGMDYVDAHGTSLETARAFAEGMEEWGWTDSIR